MRDGSHKWGSALLLLAIGLAATGPAIAAVEHHEATAHLAPWEPGQRVVVRHAFGAVRLRVGGTQEVRVRAERHLVGPDRAVIQAFLRGLNVSVSALDDRVEVTTTRIQGLQEQLHQATVNLDVSVPAQAPVEVDTSFGDLDAEGLASLQATATFGAITVRRIEGDVTLEGKHGKVAVSDVRGDVTITHSLGDVEVARVGGSLVARNQFAQVHAQEIGRRAVVDNRSGPIFLARVGAGAQVTCQFAQVQVSRVVGEVRISNRDENVVLSQIRGPVAVTNSNGSVDARDIVGDLKVDNRQGTVAIDAVQGKITVEHGDGPLKLRNAGGAADLTNSHGLIEVDGVAGTCQIRNAFGPVTVQNARGDLQISNAWGLVRVDVSPTPPPQKPPVWRLENTHGNVVIGIPTGAGCELDLDVSAGTIDSELAEVRGRRAGNRESAHATLNGGGTRLEVRVDLGMVQIQARAVLSAGPAKK